MKTFTELMKSFISLNLILWIPTVDRQKLLLGNRRQHHVDRLGVIVQRGCLAEDGKGTNDGGNGEDPEEQTVEDHGDEAPVLILLFGKTKKIL